MLKLALRGSLLLPFAAWAQGTGGTGGTGDGPPELPEGTIQSYGDVESLLLTVANWIFGILILLAVVFVLVAAFRYLTAAGDPEKVKSASNTLIYAAIAVAVALLARGIPALVGSFFGTTVTVP